MSVGLFSNIVDAFHQGGLLVMCSILFTLILSIAIIVERVIRMWTHYDLSNSKEFMGGIQKYIMNNSIENGIRLCKKYKPALLPHVISQGLKKANHSPSEIEYALEHANLEVTPSVTKSTPLLATTANVATLLGLLGTIFGLMHSFHAAATATGSQKQTELAAGISEALTATSFGLGTALICLMAYGLLMWKQKQILDDINQHSAKLLDLLYTRKMKIQTKNMNAE
ncbi:MAG: MotA/TolQ/ExbB proton channel family protein [Proteobacteria bacterium]|nr:MotA/TolQ/ExbB proton channel family protein [Pseudomonadota bacterium]